MRLMEQQPATIGRALSEAPHLLGQREPAGKDAMFGRGLRERRDGDILSKPARHYNGYAEHVASLYAGMDLERMY
jgi:hypothetical protein